MTDEKTIKAKFEMSLWQRIRAACSVWWAIVVTCEIECFDDQNEEEPKNDLVAMPKEWIGKIHNACTDPCDMLHGSCACGAWHHLDEWIITRKKLTAKGWVEPDC